MKNTILFAMIAAAVAAPLAAQAEGAYIGGNVGRSEQKIDVARQSLKESTTAFKIYGGYNYTQNFGVEAGYADLREASISGGGATATSKPRALYVAATGTLPVNEQFSVFGKLGVSANRTKIGARYTGFNESVTDNQTSPFIGVGAAYVLNKNVSLVAEYENFGKVAKDGSDSVKADLLSVGVRYAF